MSRLARKFNYGTEIKNVNDTLYNQLNDSYYSTALVVNTKATRMVSNFDAPANEQINSGLDIGDFWINEVTNQAWIMTSRATLEKVTWKQIT